MLASQIEASGKLSRKGLAKVMQQLQADHDAEEIDLDSLTEEQLRELSKVALAGQRIEFHQSDLTFQV